MVWLAHTTPFSAAAAAAVVQSLISHMANKLQTIGLPIYMVTYVLLLAAYATSTVPSTQQHTDRAYFMSAGSSQSCHAIIR